MTFDFARFPELHTERLLLRELQRSDAPAVFAFRSDLQVTHLNTGAPYTSVDQAQALIAAIAAGFRTGTELRWGITLHGQDTVIGMVGFNYWVRGDRRAQIGYDLAQPWWGRGLMPEALRAVIRFGFSEMNLNRIEADCSADNHNSVRVLEKLGFLREGLQREQYYDEIDQRFHDLLLFALLRRDGGGNTAAW